MNPVLRNVIIYILAIIGGNIVNMSTLMIGMEIFPVEGLDVLTPETLKIAYEKGLLTSKHFIFPLIAHALGTFVAALIVGYFCKTQQRKWYISVGILFLVLGCLNLNSIPHPSWFGIVDLIISYIPMAILGGILGMKLASKRSK